MDRITKAFLEEFRLEQSLPISMTESTLFELFALYCVVSNVHDEEFDATELHTGSGGDLAIDGLAIQVNGVLVSAVEEVEDLLKMNGFLDVKFVFIQAKTSSNFDGEKIGGFFHGVGEFFAEKVTAPISPKIRAARDVMNWIYDHSIKFKSRRPVVEMAYVTTGKWVSDIYLQAKIDKLKGDLEDMTLFGSVTFLPMGAREVQEAYSRSKNNASVEFNFANKALLPDIDGVAEAYIGVVPAVEFLSLITDQAGNIRRPLFYDNVRDFQGENEVNEEIKQTLEDPVGQQRFAVLNNGVTLVARELKTTKNKFAISDYQIVNGCQTSHVLFNLRDQLGSEIHIPLKVIATTDEEIINSIVLATNRQTEVTAEDLFARSDFQKQLEALYSSFPDKKKLYYERRSKQYASSNVEKVRIIGKSQQIRAFAAMFLDEAHRSARYYSDLRALVGTKIFDEEHKLESYYVAAFAHYKLEFFWRNNSIPSAYKPARYHLLMAFRYVLKGGVVPPLNSNRMERFANELSETLWVEAKAVDAFKKAIEAVDAAAGSDSLTRDLVKTQTFTDAVRNSAIALSAC